MHLRCGRREDLPYVADIASAAFWDDEIVKFLAPHRHSFPLSHRASYLYRIKRQFYAGESLIVAVTDSQDTQWTGREVITGFAVWSDTQDNTLTRARPQTFFGIAFEQHALRLQGLYRHYFNMDRSSDQACLHRFWRILADSTFFEDLDDYCELEVLAVAPAFQRRGIGSTLLVDGMRRAAKHQFPVVVAATTRGKDLYLKHGFEEVSEVSFGKRDLSWTTLTWNTPKTVP